MRHSLSLLFLIAVISILSVINDIPQDSLSHRNTVVKKVESKDVNVLFIILHILLLHTT